MFESANASHGRLKKRPSPDLILLGKDKNYMKAAALGRLFVPFYERGIPLKTRVARHVAAISALLISWAELHPTPSLSVSGWPDAEAVRTDGSDVSCILRNEAASPGSGPRSRDGPHRKSWHLTRIRLSQDFTDS